MNSMNRIGMAVGMASLLSGAAFSATAPYAFYPVSGQVVDATVSQWTASGGDSLPVASGTVVNGKANQSVSDDAPGRFIYANGEQVVADCQSYRLAKTSNKAGSFTWSDLLENLWAQTSETGGFTIEFFINPAASGSYNNENNLSIQNVAHTDSATEFEQGLTVNFVNNQKIRLTNTGLRDKYKDLTLAGFFVGTSGNYRSSLDGRWWQIAVTASRADNTARLYVNRNLAAELPWTNTWRSSTARSARTPTPSASAG